MTAPKTVDIRNVAPVSHDIGATDVKKSDNSDFDPVKLQNEFIKRRDLLVKLEKEGNAPKNAKSIKEQIDNSLKEIKLILELEALKAPIPDFEENEA